MAKFVVWALAGASWEVGTYEAETAELARAMADDDENAIWEADLCHHCAGDVDVGEHFKTETDLVTDVGGFSAMRNQNE